MTKKEGADKQVRRLEDADIDVAYGCPDLRPAIVEMISKGTGKGRTTPPTVKSVAEPPRWAEGLLVVCTGSAKRAEVIHGDLCERFARDCATITPKRARFLFRARVLASVLPLLGRTIGRMVKWTAIISAAKRLFIG
jgi:hypothetical protein